MKKILPLLLVVLMTMGIVAYAGVAFAQGRDGFFRQTAAFDDAETPLSEETPAAEEMPPAEGESGVVDITQGEPEAANEGTVSPETDFSAMTPQQLYEYLLTLETDEEIDAFLGALTPEQLAALEAYRQAMEEGETDGSPIVPAVNYTEAGPLLNPVKLPSFGIQKMDAATEEDKLVLSKAVSPFEEAYKLTLEAYATGEVRITTGNPLPTDIIMVLDKSGSMNTSMADGTKRSKAMQNAANMFITAVADKATDVLDHRIAVVNFDKNSSIISGDGTAAHAFVDANNGTEVAALKNIINDIKFNGTQAADTALAAAKNIFSNNLFPVEKPRNRVVVFLTGGAPTTEYGDSIVIAKDLKNIYKATVYTIGIFDGANPDKILDFTDNKDIENKFMHLISSNYPNATSIGNPGTGSSAGYYLSAGDAAGLNDVFDRIADKIEGGTTVTLDEAAVVKDILSPYFTLPAGADTGNIGLYTAEVDQDSTTLEWQSPVPFNSGTVTISPDGKTIGVSGFDYSENYVAPVITDEVVTGYRGTKLIIEIPIVYTQGSCFGGTVPTNTAASGIYNGGDLVEALPIPTVDIPVNYDFTPVNQSIYLTQDARLDGMFNTASGYVADGVNNAYVDIIYTIKSGVGTALGTYTIEAGDGQADGEWDISHFELEGLTANTGYTVDCTVTPVSPPVAQASLSESVMVYVFTPEVVWKDSVIWLGETANYNDNRVSAAWKNAVAGLPLPESVAPLLEYQFNPVAAAFTRDTHVGVTVKIGSFDATLNTHFEHQDCSLADCGYNAALGRFMVHVKSCSLTIAKEGAAKSTDTFIFKVTGGGRTLYVSVQGNGSQTIVGLPVDTYTVTEVSAWSWRYTVGENQVTLDAAHPSAAVTVSNTRTNDKWLGGDSHAVNTFPGAG